MVASYVLPQEPTSAPVEATLILPSSSSSVLADKTKQRQQAAVLDAWLAMHGDNLYPCREEKERLAKDMSMTYVQVNRWFANRRRKQTKRRKIQSESLRSLMASSSFDITTGTVGKPLAESQQRTLNWSSGSLLSG